MIACLIAWIIACFICWCFTVFCVFAVVWRYFSVLAELQMFGFGVLRGLVVLGVGGLLCVTGL